MSLTLEMPAEPVEVLTPPLPDTTAADQAAELLDQVDPVDDGDGEPADDQDEGNTDPTDLEAAAVATEEPEPKPKKKRGRKKKGEQAEEQAAEQVAAEEDQPVAEVTAQPAETVPVAESTPESDRSILDEIAWAEVECERAERVVMRCKRELKEAKAEYDGSVAKLRELAQAVKHDSDRPLFKQPAFTVPTDAELPPAVAPNPDLWRAAPITELGLSAKLVEKLEEAGATTIGKLEDLRAEISNGREKWPKGIGKAKITEIEDAIVTWLTKNRDSAVFGQGVVDPVAAAPQPAWEDLTEEQQSDFINQRAVQLDPDEAVELTGDEAATALEPQHTASRAFYEAGYIAGQNGDEASTCPWVPGIEMDDWLRGWLKAGKEADAQFDADAEAEIEALEESGELQTLEETAEESAAEVDSLDDL